MTSVLGIDTSAYTASVAVVDDTGVRFDQRKVISVPMGARGIRPQDAVLAHVRALPGLVKDAMEVVGGSSLDAIAVSTRPRPAEDSYLPPFEAGHGLALAMGAALSIPVYLTSHQEGHVRAGMAGAGELFFPEFYAIHVSGGTTDFLRVAWNGTLHGITALGGSEDLYGGQFVDRVGVRLGGPFPAGPFLEHLSQPDPHYPRIPVGPPRYHDHLWWISFSGPESEAMRRIDRGDRPEAVAAAVEFAVAQALASLLEKFPAKPVLVVGGVAANLRIRQLLEDRLPRSHGWQFMFAPPAFCRDNAIGVAWIGLDHIRGSR